MASPARKNGIGVSSLEHNSPNESRELSKMAPARKYNVDGRNE
jgi:hypothetical protein